MTDETSVAGEKWLILKTAAMSSGYKLSTAYVSLTEDE